MSSADRVGRAGHGQLIGSPFTLALLGAQGAGHLPVPLRQRFTLGTLRLELIPTGRGPGAAALHVDIAGRSVLYAGAVRSEIPAAALALGVEPAGVKACDAVVVAAPFGDERHQFPPIADTVAQTVAWVRAQLAAGRHAVLVVDATLDALEVAACLAAEGIPLAGSRAVRELARAASAIVAVPAIATPGKEPRATLWSESSLAALARSIGEAASAIAHVSGSAVDRPPGTAAFAWAHAAGRTALLAWIESTNAREVFVTGPRAEPIIAALGPRAKLVGPPQQMMLFDGA